MRTFKEYVKQNLSRVLSRAVSVILAFYFLTSILFSIFIFLRLQVSPSSCVKCFNITLYFCNYWILPLIALVSSVIISIKASSELNRRGTKPAARIYLYFLLILCYCIIPIFALQYALSELLFQWIPILLIVLWYKPQSKFSHKKIALTLALVLLVIILMPHITVFICYNSILAKAS